MHLTTLSTLSLAIAGVTARTTPYWFISSTKALELTSLPESPARDAVHSTMWQGLSTCPTRHYAVITQPGAHTTDYTRKFLPIGAGSRTAVIASDIDGEVIVNHIVNTILMDCLHHGVLTVEDMPTTGLPLPDLDEETIKKSIIHAILPSAQGWTGETRTQRLAKHDEYVQGVVEKYFDNKDYTLIYVAEPADESAAPVVEDQEHGLGAEETLTYEKELRV